MFRVCSAGAEEDELDRFLSAKKDGEDTWPRRRGRMAGSVEVRLRVRAAGSRRAQRHSGAVDWGWERRRFWSGERRSGDGTVDWVWELRRHRGLGLAPWIGTATVIRGGGEPGLGEQRG